MEITINNLPTILGGVAAVLTAVVALVKIRRAFIHELEKSMENFLRSPPGREALREALILVFSPETRIKLKNLLFKKDEIEALPSESIEKKKKTIKKIQKDLYKLLQE